MPSLDSKSQGELEAWHFLFKEWSKLNDMVYTYDQIFRNINISQNRYNIFFQLLLDSLTRGIAISIDIYFQEGKRYWSLSKFKANLNLKKSISLAKEKVAFCSNLRNNKFAHIPKSNNLEGAGNLWYFNEVAIQRIKETLDDIGSIMVEIGKLDGRSETYVRGFIGVTDEVDNLFNDLQKLNQGRKMD